MRCVGLLLAGLASACSSAKSEAYYDTHETERREVIAQCLTGVQQSKECPAAMAAERKANAVRRAEARKADRRYLDGLPAWDGGASKRPQSSRGH